MGVINFIDVTKCYGDTLILDNISFEVHENEKVAIIGRNGSGKTTIFNMLVNSLDYDDGQVSIRKGLNVAYLEQIHSEASNITGKEVLKTAFLELDKVKAKITHNEKLLHDDPHNHKLVKEIGRLYDKYEFMGAYNTTEKLGKVITGLNIPKRVLENSFLELSGGEQTMIMLGKVLLLNPDILLLDEPTNHLDMDACMWLENYIISYKGTVLYVSHDRYFIDKTADKIIELSNKKSKTYKGNYSGYKLQKIQEDERNLKLFERQEKEIDRLSETARRFRDYGTQIAVKRAQNIEKRIDLMDKVDKPISEKSLSLSFNEFEKTGFEMFKASKLSKTYGERTLFNDVDFIIKSSERIGVIGPNGAGKSTLIKILTGNEKATSGEVRKGKSTKYAYLEQEVLFFDEYKTMLEHVCDELKLTLQSGRNLLGKFLFSGDDVFKTLGVLSGGEKSRLRLLLEMQKNINLLILDEPTNHLDITSRENLEKAIEMFGGTIIFISHDRHFINKFAQKIMDVRDGEVNEYKGNFDYYNKMRDEDNQIELRKDNTVKTLSKNNKDKRKSKFTLRNLEKEIHELEETIIGVDKSMIENPTDYKMLNELVTKKDELETYLDELMTKWLELSE